MDDISNNLTTNSLLFADDTLIYTNPSKTPSNEQALRSDLTELGRWSKANSMELNTTKTKVLHMSLSKNRNQFLAKSFMISLSLTTKYK